MLDDAGEYSFAEDESLMGYRVGRGEWTNTSVLALAAGRDPVETVIEKAREICTRAIDEGWQGPPFDPFELARLQGIDIEANGDVRDARIRARDDGKFAIDLNPLQPRVRQRFSLAHEIAHTLFPDCAESMRNRHPHAGVSDSDWEIEALCNIAAAEFLMPSGSMPDELREGSIDHALEIRKRFFVSSEAVIMRTVQLSREPVAMFSSSRIETGQLSGRYKLDYVIESGAWEHGEFETGQLVTTDSPIEYCTAIGYTRKGSSDFHGQPYYVECVGVGGYPGRLFPRVVGFLVPPNAKHVHDGPITYLRGDALEPASSGTRVVAFMTNDSTSTWGGGIAKQVAIRYPDVQTAYRNLAKENPDTLKLGSVHLLKATDALYFAPIVAQRGYGKSTTPRISYQALQEALKQLGPRAGELEATLHMPKIGSGAAGGKWDVVREMIEEFLSGFASVFVYELPERTPRQRPRIIEQALSFSDPAY